MDPTDPSTPLQAIGLLQEALKGMPVLAVMWWMLRDVRAKVTEIVSDISNIKLEMASDNSTVRIQHTDEKLKELKDDTLTSIKQAESRLIIIETQLPQIWAKVGDRPEDIQRRAGGYP